MPTISLRLTDEQHDALTKWAHDGQRSVQKELVWRLFTQGFFATAVEQVEKHATEEIRAASGREALRAEFDTSPVIVTEVAKPKKRTHPCKHHVPPHRVCDYCDV